MRILFSVFNEDRECDKIEKAFSLIVETKWSVEQIESHFNLFDYFRSSIVVGKNLCFWDIYLFSDISQQIIQKIEEITPSELTYEQEVFTSNFLIVEDFDLGNVDNPQYPNWDKCTLYGTTRFECGASSFYSMPNNCFLAKMLI